MAQKYGGKFSPDGSDASDGAGPRRASVRVDPAGARSNLMFLPAALVLFTSLTSGAAGLTLGVVAAGLLALSAWLLRDGLRAEAEFASRKVARAPGIPRKMFSSALAGLGIAIAAYKVEPGLVAPLLFGGVTTGLHIFSFGIDPMKSKGMEGIDQFQTDRVARAVEKAEAHLAAMSDAIKRAGDRQIEARLERFQDAVRDMLRTVEEDPRDLTAARKYMGVYLMGARDATIKFADIYARSADKQAREDYLTLLRDLETNFDAKTQKLLRDSHSDLEVEIEVLRERLEREGVHLTHNSPS
ncbi:hypothetical protein G5B38_04380 [Pseudohalocynthiibacter aestuariivivens]|uniref:5-bromo-4-chloroindolyl phosphate hydrolysis family protein n=1 Tax=Roseovarius pelagicus TaxID=2980108 RepID=A0ABY6DAX9_9RHOB|nr:MULTISPECIES: 5-bromo-4-chloroindolyl phosphate hydrolysis family protein [Rhodobacterales]QIE44820.1 hypothetical protein G5B38_04380 [Pseudohalocynthiibacter aestuariivivens]UXX83272.1 5-bromo-4-chloroindolyl phosphate hydrolysis family protein [Roseovarius pelagicus]